VSNGYSKWIRQYYKKVIIRPIYCKTITTILSTVMERVIAKLAHHSAMCSRGKHFDIIAEEKVARE